MEDDDNQNAVWQQMFLASTIDQKDSQNNGRIFACPLANQKITKPFEILSYYDDE